MSKNTKTVAVHSGPFHADDALSVAILMMVYENVVIIRTRDPEKFAAADIRADVGGKYVVEENTFDHHQRGGAGARPNGIPYAGCGLVWKHFAGMTGLSAEVIELVDESFIQFVDASDNGVTLSEAKPEFAALKSRSYSFSHLVSSYNPSWQEENQDFDSAFKRAVEVALGALERAIVEAEGVVEAREGVLTALAEAEDQRVLVLDRFMPWADALVPASTATLYVCFPNPDGEWMVQCVPPALGSFEQRKPLPERLAGKRGGDLVALTGIEDAIFVHPGRFIGGAKTKAGALKLARIAVAE